MLETIKKKSKRAVLIQTILCMVVITGIMIFSKLTPIKFIMGPKPLDMNKELSRQAGQYVEYDLNLVLGSYVESVSVNKETREERTTSIGYIISDYDTGVTFAMTVGKSDIPLIDGMADDTWAWFEGDNNRLREMKIKGTIEPLSGERLRYFNTMIDEMKFEDLSYVKAYSLEMDKIGEVDMIWAFILLFVCVVLLGFMIFAITSYVKMKGMKLVNKFLNANPGVTMERIQSDFESAENIGGDIWIGTDYTFYMSGAQVRLFKNGDAAWAYYYKRTGRNPVSQVQVYFADKSVHNLNIAETLYPQILENYQNNQPHMLLGYDKDLKNLYNKNINEFLNIKYNMKRDKEDLAAVQEPLENSENDFNKI